MKLPQNTVLPLLAALPASSPWTHQPEVIVVAAHAARTAASHHELCPRADGRRVVS